MLLFLTRRLRFPFVKTLAFDETVEMINRCFACQGRTVFRLAKETVESNFTRTLTKLTLRESGARAAEIACLVPAESAVALVLQILRGQADHLNSGVYGHLKLRCVI